MSLKRTSDIVMVGDIIDIGAAFAVNEIQLPLDILNREVFVVVGVDFKINTATALSRIDCAGEIIGQVSTTRPTQVSGLQNPNLLAAINYTFNGLYDPAAVPPESQWGAHEQLAGNTPPAQMDWVGIVATDNMFFAQDLDGSIGAGNTGSVQVRVYGYRAQADAATYAALVQSEALSA